MIVTEVVADSPAERAGLAQHDILLRCDANRILSVNDLRESLQASEGKEVELSVMRSGKEKKLKVVPEEEAIENQTPSYCPALSWNDSRLYRYRYDYVPLLREYIKKGNNASQDEEK